MFCETAVQLKTRLSVTLGIVIRLLSIFFSSLFISTIAIAQTDVGSLVFNPGSLNAITTLLLSDCGPKNTEVHVGDILVETQSDLNALSNIAIIEGSLKIESSSNLNFSPLGGLIEVTGGIRFQDNSALTAIRGFECLKSTKHLFFYSNNAVTEISGFNSLETLSFFLEITNNDTSNSAALSKVSAFSSLKHIGGGIVFYRLPFLETLPSFPALETVSSYIDINRVTGINDISGFPNLVKVGGSGIPGSLTIRRNYALERITGFSRLLRSGIEEEIEVYSNVNLDCTRPAPNFGPTTRSDNNLMDCVNLPR